MPAPESLLDHLEALRRALLKSLFWAALFCIPGIWAAPAVLEQMIRAVCPAGMELHYFSPLEPLIVQLQLGAALGVAAAAPFILHALAEFVFPGLRASERRWTRLIVASSCVLMLSGAALAFFVILPLVMKFSAGFATGSLLPVIGVGAFLRLAVLLTAGFAVVFELPLGLLLAVRLGLVRTATLRKHRTAVVLTLLIVAALLTPPDLVSQLLMAVPAWLLFEAALWLAAKLEPPPEAEAAEESPPPEKAPESPGDGSEAYYRRAAKARRRIRPLK